MLCGANQYISYIHGFLKMFTKNVTLPCKDVASHVSLLLLLSPILSLTTLTRPVDGLQELDKYGENVCGPRIKYGNFTIKERYVQPCATGSCTTYRNRIVSRLDEYYCCPGFSQAGSTCSQACDSGHFGENCTQICTCDTKHAKGCNSVTGECDCVSGQGGVNCTVNCTQGTFGISCRGVCDCNTIDSKATCYPASGSCRCSAGYYGDHCERFNAKDLSSTGCRRISRMTLPVAVCTIILLQSLVPRSVLASKQG